MNNGDKPAYPFKREGEGFYEGRVTSYEGLTKREYFAAMAMQGIIASRELQLCLLADARIDGTTSENCFAVFAVKQADELLKQLNS